MRNRFKGPCDKCCKTVQVRAGVTFKVHGRFIVRHDACHSQEDALLNRALVPRDDDHVFAGLEPYEEPQRGLPFDRTCKP